jgi:hypothetical protein
MPALGTCREKTMVRVDREIARENADSTSMPSAFVLVASQNAAAASGQTATAEGFLDQRNHILALRAGRLKL